MFTVEHLKSIFSPTKGKTTTRVINGVEWKSTVNYDHWLKSFGIRKEQGLPARNNNLPDHPLVGKQFFDAETNMTYNIKKVVKQWWGGYYIALLVEHNQSHALRYWENISTDNETILESIRENREKCMIL
jgi:hypothetical protein